MIKYTSITLAKISDHGGKEKTPTHALKAKEKDSKEKPLTVGKFWTRTGDFGVYLSGVMSNSYQSADKFFDGFVIVSETELDKLIQENEGLRTKLNSPLGKDYPVAGLDEGVLDPSSIEF